MAAPSLAQGYSPTRHASASSRLQRGAASYRERTDEIERFGRNYLVPTGDESKPLRYRVCTKGAGECECSDFPQSKQDGEQCEHLIAALIFESKSEQCAGCRCYQRRAKMFEVQPGNMIFRAGDILCRECAGKCGAR